MPSVFPILLIIALLSGCTATVGSPPDYAQGSFDPHPAIDYTPPETQGVKNARIVRKPLPEVWSLLKESFYDNQLATVTYINQQQNYALLKFKFTSSNPSRFVACGQTKRVYSAGGTQKIYEYATADPSNYTCSLGSVYQNKEPKDIICDVKRSTRVNGRGRVQLTALSRQTTQVAVIVEYTFNADMDMKCKSIDSSGQIDGLISPPAMSFSTHFSTVNSGSDTWGVNNIRCQSKGTLEKEILNVCAGAYK